MSPLSTLLSSTRRQILAGVLVALGDSLRLSSGLADDDVRIFAFSRSGRFSPYSFDPLLLGGIVVAKSREREIEAVLEQRSQEAAFRIALEYGTNRNHPKYFRSALEVLDTYQAHFVGAVLKTINWQAEADTLVFWRREAEAQFMEATLSLPSIEILGVRHARGQDDAIYGDLERRLGLAPTRFYVSSAKAPRLLQVASTIIKCLGSLYSGREVAGAKATMVEDVVRHFEITRDPDSWKTARLRVETVTLMIQ